MSIITGFAIYFVIWWITLFAVLPLGVRRVENPPPGHDHGAPERPELLRKVLITTGVAAVVWLAFFALYESDLVNFRRMADSM
jgi:predicted secreted protein